ncbi:MULTISPECIES: DUF4345 family protein [Pseudoxanthomonas]|uniref:DUF4345 domain-containing protein n=1 Tax=Pseudoxanthomonas winnipegensis TaxID=2480810 RepID=A0AAW8G9S6_9GAMM|nr:MULTISPECIES: DUF4345 family protein [Pseudoxanthomonas]MDQ1119102.1 hypothetical protein [Pseudoxanthomonas winnipegensis]MDQ1132292.1 hypothetical protein [Pseudoxanthomonas winnipegensis]MDR6137695.1 hypothetical protein [Pseudoxanthomonas sp. SORGH_AS_0997]
MVNAYLWLNALLYIALALWCTLAPESTAQAVGFTALTPAGQTEFLAVYGGMEFGIGLLFAYFARSRQPRNGLVLALLFYGPIVAWRAYAIARYGLPGGTTLGLVVGEWLLLLAAAGLFLWQRNRAG